MIVSRYASEPRLPIRTEWMSESDHLIVPIGKSESNCLSVPLGVSESRCESVPEYGDRVAIWESAEAIERSKGKDRFAIDE